MSIETGHGSVVNGSRTRLRHRLCSTGLLCAMALVAGCATSSPSPAPASKTSVDGKLLANAGQFAPDAPSLPPGFPSGDAVGVVPRSEEIRRFDPDMPVPSTVVCERDVEYGRVEDYPLRLDLYKPLEAPRAAPGLVFIHGGGWERHGKDFYARWAVHYAERGYVCASIDYRTSKQAPFPAAVEDAKCAVRWMRAHAELLGADPDRVAVIGQSAGAHLALMVAYSSDVPALEGRGGRQDVSSRVQAVVDFYGPVDLTAPLSKKKSVVKRFMGGESRRRHPDRYAQASPIHYLTPGDPPTLIFHGAADGIVPVEQSDRLAETLKTLGIPYIYDREEGWNHAMDLYADVNARCLFIMDRFLETYLK